MSSVPNSHDPKSSPGRVSLMSPALNSEALPAYALEADFEHEDDVRTAAGSR